MPINDAVPEVKGTEDVNHAFAEFMTAFSAYRETNDRRLAGAGARPRRRGDGGEARPHRRGDRPPEESARRSRAEGGAARDRRRDGDARSALEIEHRGAFEAYVRGGVEGNLKAIEQKALSAGPGPDGGYLVPPPIEDEIGARLAAISPIRSIASVRTVSTSTYKKPYRVTGPDYGWVAETAARAADQLARAGRTRLPDHGLYAMPRRRRRCSTTAPSTSTPGWADEVETVFAQQRGRGLRERRRTAKPKGFLQSTTALESAWTWGKLGYQITGVSGGFAAFEPLGRADRPDLQPEGGYRQNAVFVMNRKTQAAVRKFKDTTGEYLWNPPASADGKARSPASRSWRPRTCGTWRRTRSRSPSATSAAAISWWTAPASACCAIPTAPALRAVLHHQARRRRACRISTPSSS